MEGSTSVQGHRGKAVRRSRPAWGKGIINQQRSVRPNRLPDLV